MVTVRLRSVLALLILAYAAALWASLNHFRYNWWNESVRAEFAELLPTLALDAALWAGIPLTLILLPRRVMNIAFWLLTIWALPRLFGLVSAMASNAHGLDWTSAWWTVIYGALMLLSAVYSFKAAVDYRRRDVDLEKVFGG